MKQLKRLIDVFPNWMVSGIFTELNQLNVPWKEEITADVLDLEYFGNHSGEKFIAPLIDKMLENEILPQAKIQTLAHILYTRNINQWMKLYGLYKLEYNPIENYSMIESEDGKDTRNDNFENRTEENATNNSNLNNIDQQFAFNSNDWENVNKSTNTDTTTHQNNTSQTNVGTSTNQNTRTLTRSGNIGVTTSQQMMESEIELWKWNFIEQLFEDVDKLLTLKIYI